MHKTRRFMDETSVFLQMYLILFSFITLGSEKLNLCVQTISEQYLDVWVFFSFVRREYAQKPKFGVKFSVKKKTS